MLENLNEIINKAPKNTQPQIRKAFKKIICKLGLFNVNVTQNNNEITITAKLEIQTNYSYKPTETIIQFTWSKPTIKDLIKPKKWLQNMKAKATTPNIETTIIWDNEVKTPELDNLINQYTNELEKLLEKTLLTIPDIQEIIENHTIVEFDDVNKAINIYQKTMHLMDIRDTLETTYLTIKKIIEGT